MKNVLSIKKDSEKNLNKIFGKLEKYREIEIEIETSHIKKEISEIFFSKLLFCFHFNYC